MDSKTVHCWKETDGVNLLGHVLHAQQAFNVEHKTLHSWKGTDGVNLLTHLQPAFGVTANSALLERYRW